MIFLLILVLPIKGTLYKKEKGTLFQKSALFIISILKVIICLRLFFDFFDFIKIKQFLLY